MQSVIYIYSRNGLSPILQVFDAMNLSMSAKINEVWTASFDIPLYQPNGNIHDALLDTAYLEKMNRVKISLISENIETIQFEGYISGITESATSTHVIVSDYIGVLESRIILSDMNFNSVSVSDVLTSIFSTINGTDNTGIIPSSNTADIISKSYSAGETMLSIMQDLVQWGYSFMMDNSILKFWVNIGKDRTSGPEFVEFRYDFRESRSRTIADFSIESNVQNIINSVSATNGTIVTSSDSPSIAAYGRRESMISANGDLTAETAKYLAEHKEDTKEISVTPISYDFSLVNPGDIVKVSIDRGDARGKFEGNMTVTGKEYITQWDLPAVSFTLSSSKIRTPNILEKLKKMSDDIQKLKTL